MEKIIRPSKKEYYLNIAKAVSMRSTCLRMHYGAIIVKNDEIIATGYNGSPRGEVNCCDTGKCYRMEHEIPHGREYEKCIAGDSVIKLLDGTYKTIKELADSNVSEFWTYAIDTNTGKIVPAKAILPRKTGVRDDIVEIEFDNGRKIRCTSDHKILMRDCSYKEAKDLKVFDSVMPMYYNFHASGDHEAICNTISMRKGRLSDTDKCKTNKTPTHHLVWEYFNNKEFDLKNDFLVHHKNENKLDNTPDNLVLITRSEHSKIHAVTGHDNALYKAGAKQREILTWKSKYDEEYRKQLSVLGRERMLSNWKTKEWRDKILSVQSENGKKTAEFLNNSPEMRLKMLQGRVLNGLNLLFYKIKNDSTISSKIIITEENYPQLQKKYRTKGRGNLPIPTLKSIKKYFDDLETALSQAKTYNHKVISVKMINEPIEVYDLTVPQFHNFPIDLGDNSCVFVHNCQAVHAEQNAIISASRKDIIGATLYLYGYDVVKDEEVKAMPCLICARFIKNAGIEKVVNRFEEVLAKDL